jgi:hypothetical protein
LGVVVEADREAGVVDAEGLGGLDLADGERIVERGDSARSSR